MKTTEKAIQRAREKSVEHIANFNACIEQAVCPKCASDLDEVIPRGADHRTYLPISDYKCTKCDFEHSE